MVTDLDPITSSLLPAPRPSRRRASRRRSHPRVDSFLNLGRLAREATFERRHASFWDLGLLDRLSLPLSRYHE